MHWHIQKYIKFPKHQWEICIPVFIYSKNYVWKLKQDLPKHKNNKLCSLSWFTHQKCNPIWRIDCQLSPKLLQKHNRINARCSANSKFTSVVSIPRQNTWGHVLTNKGFDSFWLFKLWWKCIINFERKVLYLFRYHSTELFTSFQI